MRPGHRGEPARVAARTRELLALFDDDGVRPAPGAEGDEALRSRRPASRWHRLAARVPVRIDPGRRAALAVGAAVLTAAVVTGIWLLSAQPHSLSVSTSAPAGAATMPALGATSGPPVTGSSLGPAADRSTGAVSTTGPPAGRSSAAGVLDVVVVDVAGKVRRPGLYRLAAGSRVDDAVRAAGGPLAGIDLSRLNLAAKVVDGEQIPVGLAGAPAPAPAPDAGPSGTADVGPTSGPVNLNSATLEQLETLPGVGPVLGQHILDWRSAHGSFSSIQQLNEVTGIGDVKFAALKPLVTV